MYKGLQLLNGASWLKSDKRIELKKTNLALKSIWSSACFSFLIKDIIIKKKKSVKTYTFVSHRVGHKKWTTVIFKTFLSEFYFAYLKSAFRFEFAQSNQE